MQLVQSMLTMSFTVKLLTDIQTIGFALIAPKCALEITARVCIVTVSARVPIELNDMVMYLHAMLTKHMLLLVKLCQLTQTAVVASLEL